MRRRIWEQACELATGGELRDVPGVLANRFSISKRTVQLVLIAEGMRHERAAATLRNGMVNLIAIARETESATIDDFSDVA